MNVDRGTAAIFLGSREVDNCAVVRASGTGRTECSRELAGPLEDLHARRRREGLSGLQAGHPTAGTGNDQSGKNVLLALGLGDEGKVLLPHCHVVGDELAAGRLDELLDLMSPVLWLGQHALHGVFSETALGNVDAHDVLPQCIQVADACSGAGRTYPAEWHQVEGVDASNGVAVALTALALGHCP